MLASFRFARRKAGYPPRVLRSSGNGARGRLACEGPNGTRRGSPPCGFRPPEPRKLAARPYPGRGRGAGAGACARA
eukprot:147855-Alexandrium_andersonii.AAC.1